MLQKVPVLLLFLCLVAACCYAQGGGHTIYGDFKVDTSKTTEAVPNLFYILLASSRSTYTPRRQPISNGGRYRFTDVANGEYDLIVELEGQEITRMRLLVQYSGRTDVRQDIELEWRGTVPQRNKASVVSALYARSEANQKTFDQALAAAPKQPERAIELLAQIVKNDPHDFVVWTELGTLYFKKEKAEEAEKAYRQALAEKPDYLLALLNLGKLQVSRKNYPDAAEILERALTVKADAPEVNYFLGEAYLGLKKGSKAVGYLNEALRLDPDGMADAHLRLAALYNAAGYKDRAAAEYEQFLAKRPNYPEKDKLQQYIKENKKP